MQNDCTVKFLLCFNKKEIKWLTKKKTEKVLQVLAM